MTLRVLRHKGLSVVTAESCTAGKLAVHLLEVPRAADHLQGGFVVYTKANKSRALGVPTDLLNSRGRGLPGDREGDGRGGARPSPADVSVARTPSAGHYRRRIGWPKHNRCPGRLSDLQSASPYPSAGKVPPEKP